MRGIYIFLRSHSSNRSEPWSFSACMYSVFTFQLERLALSLIDVDDLRTLVTEKLSSLLNFNLIRFWSAPIKAPFCFVCRILNTHCEDAATEDAIYYIGEALRRGVIDLDVFIKQLRSLSRKRLLLRSLLEKCRIKAGLAV